MSKIHFTVRRVRPMSRRDTLQNQARQIVEALDSFNMKVRVDKIIVGPAFARYRLMLNPGVKASAIESRRVDIALALRVSSVVIIQESGILCVDVPLATRADVPFSKILKKFRESTDDCELPLLLGATVDGDIIAPDLARLPHILVAGSTGSGKSTLLHSMILGMMSVRSPADLKFLLIDTKRVEFAPYQTSRHLLGPVVHSVDEAVKALVGITDILETRFAELTRLHCRSIHEYNAEFNRLKRPDKMSSLVIVIDEFADLVMLGGPEVEKLIVRIAQKSRAVGIHLVIATQRPSVDVISGLIKANIPGRIALAVPSEIDSRTILDRAGAESLLGVGDLLFRNPITNGTVRVQAPQISNNDLKHD